MDDEFVGIPEYDYADINDINEDAGEKTERENNTKRKPLKGDDGASAKLELYDWVQCVVTALVAGIFIFMFIARVVSVEGSSMYPTLHNTDKIITSKLFYTPQQGDIVVFQTSVYGSEPLVKRVIATEGQTVNIDFNAGIVYVDGEALDEPYVNAPTYEREDFEGELTVPEGYLFLMGDNRNASTDSRSDMVGLVDKRSIIGKVYLIAIPGSSDEAREWNRIGSVYN